MKKSDLKTGMYIEFKEDKRVKVFRDTSNGDFMLLLSDTYNSNTIYDIHTFPDDLSRWKAHGGVVRVLRPRYKEDYDYPIFNLSSGNRIIIWEAKKKHTVAIDGVEKEVSDESFNNLKELFEGLE